MKKKWKWFRVKKRLKMCGQQNNTKSKCFGQQKINKNEMIFKKEKHFKYAWKYYKKNIL